MLRRMVAMTPKSNSGRAASGRSPLCRNKSPPKMTTMRIGQEQKLRLGRAVSERKLPGDGRGVFG